jgi:hypothetical protein
VSRLPVMLYSGCHKHFISHNACLIMLPDGVCSPHGRTVPKNRVKAFNFIGFICAVSCRFLWLSVWCRQFILLKVQYMNSFWLLWDLRFSRRWKSTSFSMSCLGGAEDSISKRRNTLNHSLTFFPFCWDVVSYFWRKCMKEDLKKNIRN